MELHKESAYKTWSFELEMATLKKSWSLELEMHSGLGAQTFRGLAPGIIDNQSLALDKQHV